MTLARRLALFFTAVAVCTSAAIGALAYAATEHNLDAEIRLALSDSAATLLSGQTPEGLPPAPGQPTRLKPVTDGDNDADDTAGAEGTEGTGDGTDEPEPGSGSGARKPRHHRGSQLLAQLLDGTGQASSVGGRAVQLPVTTDDVNLATTEVEHVEAYRVVTVDGTRYLMLTHSRGHGRGAVQVARTLSERDEVLTRLAGSVIAIAVAVTAVAAVAGAFLARHLTRRLVRLTAVAEQVTATGRLDVAVPTAGTDEVGRLGSAFDTMLGRLARSRDDQQRLVQDAGHELRTPLTSMRTNISLLRRMGELPAEERSAVLDDLASESRELTALIDELVQLATERHAAEEDTDVDLAAVAARVAERAGRRSGRRIDVDVASGATPDVRGRAAGLERALSNLVENALKFDPDGREPVEIRIAGEPGGGLRIEVLDRGPGIPEEDLDRIFDRFHRATAVRSLPGSGLGLSIVQDVAETHEGRVFAANRPDGGAVIGFTLPEHRLQPGSNPG